MNLVLLQATVVSVKVVAVEDNVSTERSMGITINTWTNFKPQKGVLERKRSTYFLRGKRRDISVLMLFQSHCSMASETAAASPNCTW